MEVGGLIVPPKETPVGKAVIFEFFEMSSSL